MELISKPLPNGLVVGVALAPVGQLPLLPSQLLCLGVRQLLQLLSRQQRARRGTVSCVVITSRESDFDFDKSTFVCRSIAYSLFRNEPRSKKKTVFR